jgi:hypothetical protein
MKAQSVLNRILTELAQIRKVEFAQMNLENGTVLEAEEFAPENEVFILSGEERIPAPVGEHKLEDGRILVITEEGIIAEIKEEEAPATEEVEMQSEEAIAVAEEVASEVAEEASDAITEEVSAAIEVAVAEALVPIVEEVAAEMKKMRDEMAAYKAEMSAMEKKFSSQSAAKAIKHAPSVKNETNVKLASKRVPTAMDRVLAKLK